MINFGLVDKQYTGRRVVFRGEISDTFRLPIALDDKQQCLLILNNEMLHFDEYDIIQNADGTDIVLNSGETLYTDTLEVMFLGAVPFGQVPLSPSLDETGRLLPRQMPLSEISNPNRNLLFNGDFSQFQYKFTTTTINTSPTNVIEYVMDGIRFDMKGTGKTPITFSWERLELPYLISNGTNSKHGAKISFPTAITANTSNNQCAMKHIVEGIEKFFDKDVSLQFKIHSSKPIKIKCGLEARYNSTTYQELVLSDEINVSASTSHQLHSISARAEQGNTSYSLHPDNNVALANIYFTEVLAGTEVWISDIQLEFGKQPTQFMPMTYSVATLLAKRFYERTYWDTNPIVTNEYSLQFHRTGSSPYWFSQEYDMAPKFTKNVTYIFEGDTSGLNIGGIVFNGFQCTAATLSYNKFRVAMYNSTNPVPSGQYTGHSNSVSSLAIDASPY